MEKLRLKIEAEISQTTACCGIVIINPQSGENIKINPTETFPSASMIKVPIMYEIMRQAAAGTLSLEESLPVPPEKRVGGAGILMELNANHLMTISELVTLMIIISDNTATNLLIERIGMDAVNRTMKHLGLGATILQRKMMDFDAAQSGRENYSSPEDLTRLFQIIYKAEGISKESSSLMLNILQRQQVRDKLPFYWPEDVLIAHKTGTLPGAEHDGGVLYLPGGPYIAIIMTKNLAFNYEGLELGARLGKIIYDHFVGKI